LLSNLTCAATPRLTHEQEREQLEEMRKVQHAEAAAQVILVKEKHTKTLERLKTQDRESKSKLRQAGAVARRETLQDVEAARWGCKRSMQLLI
jgi:hypothetical protein